LSFADFENIMDFDDGFVNISPENPKNTHRSNQKYLPVNLGGRYFCFNFVSILLFFVYMCEQMVLTIFMTALAF